MERNFASCDTKAQENAFRKPKISREQSVEEVLKESNTNIAMRKKLMVRRKIKREYSPLFVGMSSFIYPLSIRFDDQLTFSNPMKRKKQFHKICAPLRLQGNALQTVLIIQSYLRISLSK
jgi:hypothetical protein